MIADTTGRSHAGTQGGTGGGLAITVMNADATTSITTSATIGAGAVITNAASISVTARRGGVAGLAETTCGEILVVGVGFAGGSGGHGNATDSGAVTAIIGDDASATAAGAISVTATSVTTTFGKAGGASVAAVVAVFVPVTHATHSATTSAAIGSNTGIVAGSLSVVASATTTVTVEALSVGVALVGGAGSDAQALSSGLTEARIGPAVGSTSPASPRQVVVSGAVLVAARVNQTVTASAKGGTGGAVGIGGLVVKAYADASSRAYIGNGANVQAGSLTIEVGGFGNTTNDPALRTVKAESVIGGVALVAGGGSSSTSRITGSLDAYIGAGATVVVTGEAMVRANGKSKADSTADGGNGGALAISVFFSTATIGGTGVGTRAWVGANANVRAGSLQLLANTTDDATATLLVVTVALLAGGGGTATATIDSDAASYIGPTTGSAATSVTTTSGVLNLLATSSQIATAKVTGGGGGGVNVSAVNGNATVSSTVEAFIADGTTIAAAGSVELRADAVNAIASSNVHIGSGGAIDIATVTSNASSNVTTRAYIGDSVTVGTIAVPVNGNVTVSAIGRGEADAIGTAVRRRTDPGRRAAGERLRRPAVDAHVGTSAAATRTTVVVATGTITVLARLSKSGPPPTTR